MYFFATDGTHGFEVVENRWDRGRDLAVKGRFSPAPSARLIATSSRTQPVGREAVEPSFSRPMTEPMGTSSGRPTEPPAGTVLVKDVSPGVQNPCPATSPKLNGNLLSPRTTAFPAGGCGERRNGSGHRPGHGSHSLAVRDLSVQSDQGEWRRYISGLTVSGLGCTGPTEQEAGTVPCAAVRIGSVATARVERVFAVCLEADDGIHGREFVWRS